jgi:hypothetical protein
MLAIGLGVATLLTWNGRRRHSAHSVFFFPLRLPLFFTNFAPPKLALNSDYPRGKTLPHFFATAFSSAHHSKTTIAFVTKRAQIT